MKTLLLFTVLLGVALARPNEAQIKKLAGLLKKVLEEKEDDVFGSGSGVGSGSDFGSGSGSGYGWPPPELAMDTTLFDGLGGDHSAFKLFGGLIDVDLSEPLPTSAADKAEFIQKVKNTADAISAVAKDLVLAVQDFSTPAAPTLDDIANFAQNRLAEVLFSRPDANFEPLMAEVEIALLKGAVAGTSGASKDEPGCNLNPADDAEKKDMLDCIMNKMFLASYASEVAIENSYFLLEADLDGSGKKVQICDALFNYFINNGDNEPQPGPVLKNLKSTLMCMRDNIETIRDRIGMRAPPSFPGETESDLPLPGLIKTNAFLQHVGAQGYWVMETIFGMMYVNYKEESEKRAMIQKKLANQHKLLSRAAKAYSRVGHGSL